MHKEKTYTTLELIKVLRRLVDKGFITSRMEHEMLHWLGMSGLNNPHSSSWVYYVDSDLTHRMDMLLSDHWYALAMAYELKHGKPIYDFMLNKAPR